METTLNACIDLQGNCVPVNHIPAHFYDDVIPRIKKDLAVCIVDRVGLYPLVTENIACVPISMLDHDIPDIASAIQACESMITNHVNIVGYLDTTIHRALKLDKVDTMYITYLHTEAFSEGMVSLPKVLGLATMYGTDLSRVAARAYHENEWFCKYKIRAHTYTEWKGELLVYLGPYSVVKYSRV